MSALAPADLPSLTAAITAMANDLPLLDAHRQGAELYGSPRLSVFDLFEPNENTISRVLADLFDPRGTHGQGPLFLNALLGFVGLPLVGLRDIVRVRREDMTDDKRRIDLVITTPTAIVGIENKPWAVQQHEQLAAYVAELKRRTRQQPNWRLVFLSDQQPASASTEVRRLPYVAPVGEHSLRGILALLADQIKASRVRDLVSDFLKFIDERIGWQAMIDTRHDAYIAPVLAQLDDPRPDHKRAIAAIMLARDGAHRRIIDSIGKSLLERLKKDVAGDFVVTPALELSTALGEKWRAWLLRRPGWPDNCGVGLAAEGASYSGIIYGLHAPMPGDRAVLPDEACLDAPKLRSAVANIPPAKSSPYWPWYKFWEGGPWDAAFALGLTLDSPTGLAEEHATIVDIGDRMVELAKLVDSVRSGA